MDQAVARAVEFRQGGGLEIFDTDRGIILKLHNAEILMTPEAARRLAQLLLRLAEKSPPAS
jgi:hypothetical protein